jgi:hypothetical protein
MTRLDAPESDQRQYSAVNGPNRLQGVDHCNNKLRVGQAFACGDCTACWPPAGSWLILAAPDMHACMNE